MKKCNLISMITSIITIILIFTVCRPCDMGMKCVMTRNITAISLGVLSLTYIPLLISKKDFEVKFMPLYIIQMILSVFTLLSPTIFGTCQREDMMCNTHFVPCILFTSSILRVLNLLIRNLLFRVVALTSDDNKEYTVSKN